MRDSLELHIPSSLCTCQAHISACSAAKEDGGTIALPGNKEWAGFIGGVMPYGVVSDTLCGNLDLRRAASPQMQPKAKCLCLIKHRQPCGQNVSHQ